MPRDEGRIPSVGESKEGETPSDPDLVLRSDVRRLLLPSDLARAPFWVLLLFSDRISYPTWLGPFLTPAWTRLLLLVAGFLALILTARARPRGKRVKWLSHEIWRFAIFPVRLPITAILAVYHAIRLTRDVLSFPKRPEAFIPFLLIGAIAMRLVVRSTSPSVLISSMVALGLWLVVSWIALYSWTTSPHGFSERVLNLIFRVVGAYVRKGEVNGGASSASSGGEPQSRPSSGSLKFWMDFFTGIESWASTVDKMRLIRYFLLMFAYALIVTVAIFGFEYFALEKLCTGSFAGLGLDIWEYLYYSAVTFVTLAPVNQYPVTNLARAFVLLEVFTTIFFLTIIVLTFTTTTEDKAKSYAGIVKNKAAAMKSRIHELIDEIADRSPEQEDSPR
jgi:hypothetical protein